MKYAFKHLQSLVAVALCVIIAAAFVGCSDDDDEPEEIDLAQVVVGTWVQDGDNDILTVNANGTGFGYDNPTAYQNNQVGYSFNWSYEDGWVTVTSDGHEIARMRAQSFSQNKIVWQRYAIASDGDDPSEGNRGGHDAFGYYDLWTWERYSK